MTDLPQPEDEVPDFLIENFETEPPRTLKAINECAHDTLKRQGVPEYARDAFALQDEETRMAVARYTGALAEFLEEEGYDTLEAVPEETYLNPSEVSDADISESEDADEDGGILGLF
jgi:hypothetical protein